MVPTLMVPKLMVPTLKVPSSATCGVFSRSQLLPAMGARHPDLVIGTVVSPDFQYLREVVRIPPGVDVLRRPAVADAVSRETPLSYGRRAKDGQGPNRD